MARIIGIVSGKGGVGKTTVTVNLGSILAQKLGKKVTIVDCNLTTSHLGLYAGIYYSPITLNRVLRGEAKIDEVLCRHFSGMDVVPASLSIRELDGVDITLIKKSIEPLLNKNDIILLDSAPGLGRESMAVLMASEEVLYVTTPFLPCILDIVRYQEVVREMYIKEIGIVLNMVGYEGYELSKHEIEEQTGLPVIASIPYDKNIKESLATSVPVVNLNPRVSSSKELFKLAHNLLGIEYRNEGLFSRILKIFQFQKKFESP